MYSTFLAAHSLLRWAVIAAAVIATIRAWQSASSPAGRVPRLSGLLFTILFDVQFLLGLVLYLFLSPRTIAALHDMGAAMADNVLRFWAIEHPFGMIVALALAHVGRAKLRASDGSLRRAAIYFTLALVIVLLTTPWPFMPYGRPLF